MYDEIMPRWKRDALILAQICVYTQQPGVKERWASVLLLLDNCASLQCSNKDTETSTCGPSDRSSYSTHIYKLRHTDVQPEENGWGVPADQAFRTLETLPLITEQDMKKDERLKNICSEESAYSLSQVSSAINHQQKLLQYNRYRICCKIYVALYITLCPSSCPYVLLRSCSC